MSVFKKKSSREAIVESVMDEHERQVLAKSWAKIACVACGDYHPGLCSRIEEIQYYPNGTVKKIGVRPANEWKDMPGSITASEVFEAGVPTTNEPESPLQETFRRIGLA